MQSALFNRSYAHALYLAACLSLGAVGSAHAQLTCDVKINSSEIDDHGQAVMRGTVTNNLARNETLDGTARVYRSDVNGTGQTQVGSVALSVPPGHTDVDVPFQPLQGTYLYKFTFDAPTAGGGTQYCGADSKVLNFPRVPTVVRDDIYELSDSSPGDQLDVLNNDVASPGATLTIVGVTQPAHGSVTIESGGGQAGGDYIGWTNPGTRGPYADTFSYTVQDSFGQQATAQVTLNVACAMRTLDAAYAMGQGQGMLIVAAPGFVAHNDTCGKPLPQGHLDSGTKHGALSLGDFTDPAQAGSFTYTPSAGFVGVDDFEYSYDGEDAIGTVTIVVQSTSGAATTTSLASDHNPALIDQPVTFTATVAGGASPTGTVSFATPDTVLCLNRPLADGKATCAGNVFAEGTYSVTATYTGDANNQGSTSAPLTQVVDTASTLLPTTTSLESSMNPSLVGHSIDLTATVSGGQMPSGTIKFTYDLSSDIPGCGAVVLNGRSAVCEVPPTLLVYGLHTIIATYSGDAANAGSASAPLTQAVDAPTGTTQAIPAPTLSAWMLALLASTLGGAVWLRRRGT